MTYQKFTYWLEENEFLSFSDALAKHSVSMYEARKAVCRPLSKNMKIGVVPPDAWRKTDLCKRPLSWYWQSPYAGQYLVISSDDLGEYGLKPNTILRATKFRPKILPDEQEKQCMISRETYLRARPDEWEDLSSEDPAKQERWMKVMGIRGRRYEDLFLTHCANHANFIEPVYFVEEDAEKIPYSIAKTKHICSACLELFNVIGREFKKKLVAPCPGAVIFAGLPVNKYIEVNTVVKK